METSIFELIRQAELLNNEAILRFVNKFNGPIGLSQILVLDQLRRHGPQMQSALAKKLSYTPGGMTSIADKLVKEGFAKRESDANDRRIVFLAVTDKGMDILDKASKAGHDMRKDYYSILTEEEIQQLISIQKKMFEHLVKGNGKETQ